MVFSEYSIYHKSMAKMLGKLKDNTGAGNVNFKRISAISPEDPSIIYMLARY